MKDARFPAALIAARRMAPMKLSTAAACRLQKAVGLELMVAGAVNPPPNKVVAVENI